LLPSEEADSVAVTPLSVFVGLDDATDDATDDAKEVIECL
jgi:hypothetical protein